MVILRALRLPLADAVRAAGPERVVVECTLDAEADAFLREHRLGDRPLLPAVASLELMAEAAVVAGVEGLPVLEDVVLESGLLLEPGGRRLARGTAERDAGGGWRVTLSADVVSRRGRLLATDRPFARARARQASSGAPHFPADARRIGGQALAMDYQRSAREGSRIVHGPPFQGLRTVEVSDGDVHEAHLVALPAEDLRPARPDASWLVPAAALDACLQACGLVAHVRLGVASLPSRFGRIQVFRVPASREECVARIVLHGQQGQDVRCDFILGGGVAGPVLQVEGYVARAGM